MFFIEVKTINRNILPGGYEAIAMFPTREEAEDALVLVAKRHINPRIVEEAV